MASEPASAVSGVGPTTPFDPPTHRRTRKAEYGCHALDRPQPRGTHRPARRSRCKAYDALVGRGLKLDMTRGKPSPAQLDLSNELLVAAGRGRVPRGGRHRLPQLRRPLRAARAAGDLRPAAQRAGRPADRRGQRQPVDHARHPGLLACSRAPSTPTRPGCRGAGQVHLPGARLRPALRAVRAVRHRDDPGAARASTARTWSRCGELVAEDPAVKGIWIVPTYANPTGAVYTEEVTRALLEMPAAAPDFRMFWDNAYAVHHLTEVETPALDMLGMAEAAGQPEPAVPVRLHLEDHLRRGGGLVLRQLAGQRGLVPAAPGQADHRAGQGQPPAACAVPEAARTGCGS